MLMRSSLRVSQFENRSTRQLQKFYAEQFVLLTAGCDSQHTIRQSELSDFIEFRWTLLIKHRRIEHQQFEMNAENFHIRIVRDESRWES